MAPAALAAGYAPVFEERRLDNRALHEARQAIDLLLKSTEPFPALVVDRGWNLVAANAALQPLMSLVADRTLLQPPINVMRLSLHPGGLASRVANLPEWRGHLLDRLFRQVTLTAGGTPEAPLYPGGTDFIRVGPDGLSTAIVGFVDATPAM
jgi:hypothetical protein